MIFFCSERFGDGDFFLCQEVGLFFLFVLRCWVIFFCPRRLGDFFQDEMLGDFFFFFFFFFSGGLFDFFLS